MAIAGIVYANKAKAKGNPGAMGPLVVGWIAIAIWIILTVVYTVLGASIFAFGKG